MLDKELVERSPVVGDAGGDEAVPNLVAFGNHGDSIAPEEQGWRKKDERKTKMRRNDTTKRG